MKNKKEKNSVLTKLSQRSGVPFDMLTHLPLTKMYSNREIYIEDAGQILRYESECIVIFQRKMLMTITGKQLKLKSLANKNVSVEGSIESVIFNNGEREE